MPVDGRELKDISTTQHREAATRSDKTRRQLFNEVHAGDHANRRHLASSYRAPLRTRAVGQHAALVKDERVRVAPRRREVEVLLRKRGLYVRGDSVVLNTSDRVSVARCDDGINARHRYALPHHDRHILTPPHAAAPAPP